MLANPFAVFKQIRGVKGGNRRTCTCGALGPLIVSCSSIVRGIFSIALEFHFLDVMCLRAFVRIVCDFRHNIRATHFTVHEKLAVK